MSARPERALSQLWQRARLPLRAGVLYLLAVLIVYVVAVSWTAGRLQVPLVLAAASAAAIALLRPRAVALLVLLLGASILKPPAFPFGLGGLRTDAHEAVSYALIGAWLAAMLTTRSRAPRTAFAAPLLALAVAALVGCARGILAGADPYLVKGFGKTWLLYLLGLP
ncbi:MAG TPA: hypothetical protein VM093_04205, partial [Aeromicrobium sp.]|nr:hypothetical protein [Aeromicrobium sp.]